MSILFGQTVTTGVSETTMSASRETPRVLLVQQPNDDVEMYVEFFSAYGFTIIVASTLDGALLAAGDADIIVTAIKIDGEKTGIDLIMRLREDLRTNRKPIIVLSAAAWQDDRDRAKQAGCDMFLAKPCLPKELLHRVRLLWHARAREVDRKIAQE